METRLVQWRRFVSNLGPGEPASDAIVASWQRSALAGVNPQANPAPFRKIPERDLAARLERNAIFIRVARPLLHSLLDSLPGESNVCYIADADGIVLYSCGAAAQLESLGLTPGYDWSERSMGTNGIGTALATGRPAAVVGPDHFSVAFHDCTCTGAPIRDPSGNVIGAVDASSSVRDATEDRLRVVTVIAWMIERAMRKKQDSA
jgi:sigma-54 dependent transcriptional regulator, acetoin dehydrogenase operon transcriptional activator AcoR